jgi:hypothetical protein
MTELLGCVNVVYEGYMKQINVDDNTWMGSTSSGRFQRHCHSLLITERFSLLKEKEHTKCHASYRKRNARY